MKYFLLLIWLEDGWESYELVRGKVEYQSGYCYDLISLFLFIVNNRFLGEGEEKRMKC